MAWRKWLVRGLVFSILGVAVLAALLYEAWTNPRAVRKQVLEKLGKDFAGATISLDSARLRLLGGIAVHDLRMARREDLDRGDFLYVPSAVIYHDKEHLLDGSLGIRKVELDRPRLRIVRERDGRLNLAGVLAPTDLNQRVPTLLIHQGTILVEDRSVSGESAVLEIKDVNLTIINDPLTTLVVEGTGQADLGGAVEIHARFHRPTGAASAVVDLPGFPVNAALVRRIAAFGPEIASHLRELQGDAKIQATLVYHPGAFEPWTYDIDCGLTAGKWSHACLPGPLDHIEATLHCRNGCVPKAHLTARSGPATIDITLRDLAWPGQRPSCIEEAVREIDARVEHLLVTDKFFEPLPPACKEIQRLYSPTGPVSLAYTYRRTGTDQWHKHWDIQPEGMSAEFEHFRYPIEAVSGLVRVDLFSDHNDYITVDLAGRASDRPLTLKGSVRGDKPTEVDLVVNVENVPVDHTLLRALPEKSQELARTFLPPRSRELGKEIQPLGQNQPAGLVDIKAYIHRERGQHEFSNRYIASFHNTSLQYDMFPYPLENVSGVLDIQPDHWECQDFHGTHKGGEIRVEACSYHVPGVAPDGGTPETDSETTSNSPPPPRECVRVRINGQGILLDEEFNQALSPAKIPGRAALRNAWAMLALQGRLNFEASVVDRPDQPQDIDVMVGIGRCAMRPEFFPYAMTDLSARVRYAHGRVYVQEASARHERCQLHLKDATIDLKPAGGFRAWFHGIGATDLLPDEDFLRALHPAMRKALEPLQVRKPIQVHMPLLVFDAPAIPSQPMKIWWEGGALLHQQAFHAGLDIDEVEGEIFCTGHHNGQQFERVTGYALLGQANILGQPFRNLQGRIEIHPDTPDVLRLYDLKADLFGGFVGGEAHFKFDPSLRYEVKLDALHVQLEQFGRHNRLGTGAQLQGPARASLHLMGEGTDLSGLKGNGRVEVANGKLYRLPLLLDLLKAIGLRVPDRTAFEQARMIFAIEGPQMRIQSLDLFGNAISLRGQGTLDLDGNNLNLDFSADWGRMSQILPPGFSDVSEFLSDQLFKIKMRGKISSPRFDKELMPGVVDPLKKAFGGS